MAHMAKYQSGAVGNMFAHYDRGRGTEGRENIDPALTANNYTVGLDSDGNEVVRAWERRPDGSWETFAPGAEAVSDERERVAAARVAAGKRATRKDAVVLVDWIVTAPTDLPERDEELFFKASHKFLAEKFGEECVMPGRVHRDEPGAKSHMHVPMLPVTEDADGVPAFAAKRLLNRTALLKVHPGLQKAVDEALGYHVSVILDEAEAGKKQLSHLSHAEYEKATAELQAVTERLEGVRQRQVDAVEAGQLGREAGREIVAECEEITSGADEIESRVQEARERVDELGERCQEARERVERLEGEVLEARERESALRRAAQSARFWAEELMERVKEAGNIVIGACSDWARSWIEERGGVDVAVRGWGESFRLNPGLRHRDLRSDAPEVRPEQEWTGPDAPSWGDDDDWASL